MSLGPVSFLTPPAALVSLAALLPLVVLVGRERRARRVRKTLGLAEPAPRTRRTLAASLLAASALMGLAAAQPVIDRSKTRHERADAEVLVVLDTSRSMLASRGRWEPTRIDRGRAAALEIRSGLAGVPAGLASLTDRVLPHLFPTVDELSFASTLSRSIGIERPGPYLSYSGLATNLGALADVGGSSFFSRSARRRLLVVLTDGETSKVDPDVADALRNARIRTLFLHFWKGDERVYLTSSPEPQYRPDPSSGPALAQLAELVGGAVFTEDNVGGAVARAREELGEGPTRPRTQRDLLALMPYVTLAALLPVAVVLRRRNL